MNKIIISFIEFDSRGRFLQNKIYKRIHTTDGGCEGDSWR